MFFRSPDLDRGGGGGYLGSKSAYARYAPAATPA